MYLCAVKNKLPINIAKFLTEYTMKQKVKWVFAAILFVSAMGAQEHYPFRKGGILNDGDM